MVVKELKCSVADPEISVRRGANLVGRGGGGNFWHAYILTPKKCMSKQNNWDPEGGGTGCAPLDPQMEKKVWSKGGTS